MFKLGIMRSLGSFVGVFLLTANGQAQPAVLGEPLLQLPALPAPQPASAQPRDTDDVINLLLQLTPPPPERLFQFKSEEKVREQIREQFKNIRKVEFPPTVEVAPHVDLPPRPWPSMMATAAPSYVCYKRLWFEQRNSERYGWDFGILQPFISTSVFYADLALMPWHWMTNPCRWHECSAGQCLPGDPVPLLWNPVFGK